MIGIKPRRGESKKEYMARVMGIMTCIDWKKHCLRNMYLEGDFTYLEEIKETLDCQYANKDGEPHVVIENNRFWDLSVLMANALVDHRGFKYIDEGWDEEGTRLYWKVQKGENIYEFSFRRTFGKTFVKQLEGNEDDFWDDLKFIVGDINDNVIRQLNAVYYTKAIEIKKEPVENWYEKELAEAIKLYDKTVEDEESNRFQEAFKDFYKDNGIKY